MKAALDTLASPYLDIKRLAIYKEALHLFALSRKLSKNNSSLITLNGAAQKELATQLSEHITTSALSLPLSIAEAAVTEDCYKKLYFKKTIEERIDKILKLSTKLEELYSHSDYIVQELSLSASNLQRGFKRWSTHLTFQN